MNQRFVTALSIDECQRLLADLRLSPRMLEALPAQTGDQGIFGDVRGERIRLYARSVMVINTFRRIFYGRLEAFPGGTLIEGEFRVPLWVRIFAACWLSFAGIPFLFFIIGTVIGSFDWTCLLIPAFMFFGGLAMRFLGPALGESEEAEVLSFIRTPSKHRGMNDRAHSNQNPGVRFSHPPK